MRFSVHRLWRLEAGLGSKGFFSLIFFLPLLKPFPSNPSPTTHIQLLAILPTDPLRSPNGVWVSEGFSLCTWQSHVAGRLQGRRWGGLSSLGTVTGNGVAVIYFPSSKVIARQMWLGRQTGDSPQPHQGLLPYCPWGGSGECGWCWRGEGEGQQDEKEEAAEGGEVRSRVHSRSGLLGLLHQPSPSSASLETLQPPYKLWSPWRETLALSSFLPFHCLHSYIGSKQVPSECLLNGINSVPPDLWIGFILVIHRVSPPSSSSID